MEIIRLPARVEAAVADLAEESAAERAKADIVERNLAEDAGKLIEKFLAGSTREFAVV